MFYYAGVIYRGKGGWKDWSQNYFGTVAALLSHGQRVLVQIPPAGKGGDELWPWLNREERIPTRSMSSHGLSPLKEPTDLTRGHRQYLTEEKSFFAGVIGWHHARHYGFNPALGGIGNRNPFSSTNDDANSTFLPINGDGRNGHVYIYYLAPGDNQFGGMLVGCENAEYGVEGGNPHTSAGHSLSGKAQKVSACGGKKWSALNIGPREEYNGMICDLTDRFDGLDWLFRNPLFDPDWLDQKTKPVVPINPKAKPLPVSPKKMQQMLDGPVLRPAHRPPLVVSPGRAIPK
jgi:hypothetical protein